MTDGDKRPDLRPLALEGDGAEVLSRWMERLARRSLTLRTIDGAKTAAASPNGADAAAFIRERCGHFLRALEAALEDAPELDIGGNQLREAVQSLAFTGGWMAGEGLPISDAIAVVHALEEALGWDRERFFQALVVTIAEAYASSLAQRGQSLYRDAMEKCQLVLELHPRLPMLFMAGDPDRQAVDDAVGRVMMLAAMRESPLVMVDVSDLMYPEEVVPQAAEILAEHSAAASVRVLLSGAAPAVREAVSGTHGEALTVYETVHEAMREATAVLGTPWPEA